MHENKPERSSASSEKRDPGFAKIHRGLLEHWPEMSVNARAFYIWLQLTANWKGPKRGWVEASFEDMAAANGWSVSTVKRTIHELEAKPYIDVERASNQYELTRIRILKYDLEESESAPVSGDHSSVAPVSAPVSGTVKSDHSKPASPQNPGDLHASKKLRSKERVCHDRRRDDLSLSGKAFEDLKIKSLPVTYRDFAELAEANPRGEAEHFVPWARRILGLCKEQGVDYPKVFLRRLGDAERALENEYDPYGEIARVAGPRGVRPELMR